MKDWIKKNSSKWKTKIENIEINKKWKILNKWKIVKRTKKRTFYSSVFKLKNKTMSEINKNGKFE